MTQSVHDLLEQHFDAAFAASDGIAKLRELILTLAMQGKLVEQDPNDPPASELLKEIEAEKLQLVKVGKIKKPKILPAIGQADAPYALPKGWIWTRLGNIGNIFNGNSINAKEKETKYAGANGLPYIATKDVGYGLDELDYKNGIYIPESEEKFKIAHQGAVLICAEGGSAGKKCGVTEQDVCFGNKLFANELFCGIPSKFILYLYLSPVFRKSFNGAMTGIIGGVSIAKFLELPVPLPPLEEQNRIVARIDDLMVRCNKLEKLREDREEKRLQVHAAAIKQILDAPENAGWSFIQQHFGELHTVKENIAELRKAILQLAIMGRLVPQDPNDPPVSELLKEIEAEKQRLIAEKKIKRQKPLPPVKQEEIPYELPEGWEWVRLGEITDIKGGKRVSNGYQLLASPTPHVYIRVSDMKNGSIDTSDLRYIDEEMYSKIKNYIITKDDIYMTIVGATIGKCGTIPDELDGMNLTENAARLVLYRVDKRFLHKCLDSNFCQQQFVDKTKQVGVQKMALIRLASTLIPLPPLPEQHRIVARIDQLMALCDKLDKQIEAATNKQEELLNVVMAQV